MKVLELIQNKLDSNRFSAKVIDNEIVIVDSLASNFKSLKDFAEEVEKLLEDENFNFHEFYSFTDIETDKLVYRYNILARKAL